MSRKVALVFAVIVAALSQFASAVTWMGNTKLYEGANNYPARGFYLESSQALTITTQTYPIAPNQQVSAFVTTNNWQSSQEYVFTFDKNVGNNSQWYCVLPKFPKNTWVQFYLRCQEYQNGVVYDNNGSANFGFLSRSAPNYSDRPILQWFETDYQTIMARLPEVVMAGYGAIYLPPPSKSGGGTYSAGYNMADPFDLGDRLQFGSARTKYGSTQELQELIRVAKRLGIEVYCDLILNHMDNRASTAIDKRPGFIPEDYHIKSSANTTNAEINFSTAGPLSYEMFFYDVSGLTDFAQEDGNATQTGTFTLPSFATWSGNGKPSFIRNNTTPQYYPGASSPYAEDVGSAIKRLGVFLTDVIGFDGFRLDAVKHIPPPFLGYAPDQPTGGRSFSSGDMLNHLYWHEPDLYIFGENYATDSYSQREYAKTGMNLLDFPLFFAMQDLFNSHGYGDMGAKIANAYGVDGNGLPYQNGGLGPNLGVSFVQSHDNGPPEANNLAYAFQLTRPGRPLVYYDGNNVLPGNWAAFPKPGRGDALGTASDVVPSLVDVHNRFARGTLVNRYTSANLYVYERQVSGKGTVLVGLNNRGDLTEMTATVTTAFPAGTVLTDLSKQRPNVTVGANGSVSITVPSNSNGTVTNNATGYVLYAPITPGVILGTNPVEIKDESRDSVKGGKSPVTTYNLPRGTYGVSKSFQAATVTGDSISINVNVDGTGYSAFAKIDDGSTIPNVTPLSNTQESLTDGFFAMSKRGAGVFRATGLDLTQMEDGLHSVRVRVFTNYGSGAPVYNDFVSFFYLNRTYRGSAIDGVITSSITAGQTRTASSNANRCDSLNLANDDTYLYVSVPGRVDGSEGYTNGFSIWMDTDPAAGTGVTNLQTLADDSGPACRLLSNRKATVPSGFGAEMGIAMFRGTGWNAAPESPLASGLATPFEVGAAAGAFRFTANNRFTPVPSLMAYQQRTNKTDSPRGLEAAIRLTDVFSGGLPATPKVGFLVSLGTTGEAGTTLSSSDPNFMLYGGRPAYQPYVTNQWLPVQSSIVNDPGTGTMALNAYTTFTLAQANTVDPVSYTVTEVERTKRLPNGDFQQVVSVSAVNPIAGPVTLLVNPGGSFTLRNRTSVSLKSPGSQSIRVSSGSMSPGQTITLTLKWSGPATGFVPTYGLRSGNGLY